MSNNNSHSPAPHDRGAGEPGLIFTLRDLGVELEGRGRRIQILKDISFDVRTGEFLGIVGRSGTGKTTLLRALAGLIPATGTLEYEGRPLTGPQGTSVMVFQDYAQALLPWRTVLRNVELGLEGRVDKPERHERAMDALRMVGLEARAQDYPWRLSGGMQQRVQIARAVAMKPRVLLMDEPFGALDAMTKASLQDQLLRVQEETNSTIVFITHDMEEAVYLSDRVVVIQGTPGTVGEPIATNLPRPRDQITTRESSTFLEIRHLLSEVLRDDAG